MPLTEFLRMSKGRMDATQQRSSLSSDPSCRPETDFVELVWENGQIMMQGQSNNNNKPKKVCSIQNNLQALGPKPQEVRSHPNGSKMVKFSMMDDNSSSEMGLDHDAEMVSWLNYPFEETLQTEYPSDFLRELSGVTMNDFSNEKHGNPHQGFLAPKHRQQGESSELQVPRFSPPFQQHHNSNSNIPTSGVSAVTGNNNNRSSHCNTSSLRFPSTSSGFTNFPCISRHAALARANHKDVGSHNNNNNNQSAPQQMPINNGNSESSPPRKPAEEVFSSNQAKCAREDVAKNDVGKPGERNVEPVAVAASSVCSGNSVERTSSRDLKRKSRETESEGPSEEFEEESVRARKAPPNRTGSKRTRAAEVHNLSERRRRDRINEKMRALQELIPNCNKVDKASMLDEAIEYLKTLQLQVQMLSMGTSGLYMQPMMLPPGIQSPLQGAPHMPHFSPMMGLGMGYGFNMLDINGGGGMKMMPFQGPHYGPAFPAMPSSSVQTFGRPGLGLPMAIHHRAPVVAGPTVPPLNVNVPPVGLTASGVAGPTNAPSLVPTVSLGNVGQQMVHSKNVEGSLDPAPNQSTMDGTEKRSVDQAQAQAQADPAEVAVASSGTDAMPS